jgi:two-component system NtrC family response regulator
VLAGTFREELFYRLNVVQISMPPLRERREDIPLLVAHFIKKFMQENNVEQAKTFTQEALNYINSYDWPGNIGQLQNIIERCLVMGAHSEIGVEDLPPEIRDEDAQFKSAVDLLPVAMNLTDTLDKIEAAIVRRALARADFVQSRAGELLGISRSLIQYKLKKYNITGH